MQHATSNHNTCLTVAEPNTKYYSSKVTEEATTTTTATIQNGW